MALSASQSSTVRENDLRRLRFHRLIERLPNTHRYRITAKGLRTALFYTRLYDRSLRTGLAIISPAATSPTAPKAKSIRAAETAINNWYDQTKLAASELDSIAP